MFANVLPDLDTLPTAGSLLFVNTNNIQTANHIANDYARKILNQDSARSAALLDAKTHPDFRLITTEEKSQQIKIDQIRDLLEWVNHKPLIASKKVAVITPAHLLNVAAANALLKILEETSAETLFILVTDKPSFIPTTVLSRCFWVRLKFNNELQDTATAAKLNESLAAFNRQEIDLISLAIEWTKQDPKVVCDAFFLALHATQATLTHPTKRVWQLLDSIIKAKQALLRNSQPNLQLLFESFLLEYQALQNSN